MRDTRPPLKQQAIMTSFMDVNPYAAIFASPGLGKTRAVIDTLRDKISDCANRGALIISPKRVSTLTWPSECKRWEPDFVVANLRTEAGMRMWNQGSAHIYHVNQEYTQQFIANCVTGRKKLPVDILVIDELTKFKNPSALRGKALHPHLNKFERRIGLTGTPTPNGYTDLYAQIRMLDGGERFGKAFHKFRKEYFASDYMGFVWTLKEGSKERIEDIIADISITLRAEDWMDIPPVTVEDIEITLPPDVMKEYLKLEKDMLLSYNGTEIVAPTAAALLTKLRQFSGGAVFVTDEDTEAKRTVREVHGEKIEALRKLHIAIKRAPLLVATQYTHEVDRILAAFPNAKRFNEKDIDEWNNGKIEMWVANSSSISHGLNLQGPCSNIFWFSLPFDFDGYHQFNCRIARTGQTAETKIWRCLVNDSVDWSVAEVLRSKAEGQNQLLAALVYLQQIAANRS